MSDKKASKKEWEKYAEAVKTYSIELDAYVETLSDDEENPLPPRPPKPPTP